jgi:fermentation-respiration switch protein FrsA (DUF1100 family)
VAARIGIFLAVILILAYLFAQYVRHTGMFFPSRDGDWNAADGHTDVWFNAPDGVRLHGWLFRTNDPNAPLMVWCHGNAGNIIDRAPMAAEIARRGVSVLLFDWRGYGKSDGRPDEDRLYDDALAAHDFAAKSLAPRAIVMYGESLGGPYAAYVAKERKVRGVIIENSFPSLAALGNALYHPIPLGWFAPRAMLTTRWLNEAGVPVLVMHGRRDAVIPFPLGQKLYDGLRVPKEMIVSDTASHCEIASAEPEKYYSSVVRFARGTG